MRLPLAALFLAFAAPALSVYAADSELPRPKAGPVEIMPLSQVKPGMKGVVWTVFEGLEPEAVPLEIIGIWKNSRGPQQDVILGRLGGRAAKTYVAGGMSGSPAYVDGKLIGALSLRVGQSTTEPICGITPIERMLEISDYDKTRPDYARTPGKQVASAVPAGSTQAVGAGSGEFAGEPLLVPIQTPIALAGFTEDAMRQFAPQFQQMGVAVVQGGGAGSAVYTNKPAPGWEKSLNPGEAVAAVLVNGDMGVTGLGTVTYNDGKRVMAFGHSLFDLGPVDIPMSRGEVLIVLPSQLQPNKLANATEIVGALRQDRYSGIMGTLGAESPMIPVNLKVRSLDDNDKVLRERDLRFNVFVHQKWTPYLMTLTLYNTLSQMNELTDEATYSLTGNVEFGGLRGQSSLSLSNMQASGEVATPAPLVLANWWGERFNKLYLNNVTLPDIKRVNVTVDLTPTRRAAVIENAWVADPEVRAGDDVPVKVFLRPYRGDTVVREFKVHIPAGIAKGDHRIVLSDADTANRMPNMAGQANRFIDLPQAISLLNQERANNKLYVALAQSSPTAYYDDKTMPSLPSSVLNVMQTGRASNRAVITSQETATEQMSLPFDFVVTGSYSLRIHVK